MVSKFVEIALVNNIQYYENLGYKIPRYYDNNNRLKVKRGTKILVNVKDIPLNSHALIEIKCDYCNTSYYITIKEYNNSNKNIINKDCCKKCIGKKNVESNLLKYGVCATSQIPEVVNQMKLKYDDIKLVFESRNCILISKEYNNCSEELEYICNNHQDKGIQKISWNQFNRGFGCKYCGYEKISGKNSPHWKGGISELTNYIRGKIFKWKFDSFKANEFKCLLTGLKSQNLVIHHLYSFTKILEESLEMLSIPFKSKINNYTQIELELIENKCLELHYQKGLGVPILSQLHSLFHSQVGKLIIDNGEFEEFKKRYYNFEFDSVLDDKYKYVNIFKGIE